MKSEWFYWNWYAGEQNYILSIIFPGQNAFVFDAIKEQV